MQLRRLLECCQIRSSALCIDGGRCSPAQSTQSRLESGDESARGRLGGVPSAAQPAHITSACISCCFESCCVRQMSRWSSRFRRHLRRGRASSPVPAPRVLYDRAPSERVRPRRWQWQQRAYLRFRWVRRYGSAGGRNRACYGPSLLRGTGQRSVDTADTDYAAVRSGMFAGPVPVAHVVQQTFVKDLRLYIPVEVMRMMRQMLWRSPSLRVSARHPREEKSLQHLLPNLQINDR